MATEEFDDARDDKPEEEDGMRMPRVIVQPHKLGGIEVAVRDLTEGRYVGTRIDIPEAALVLAHLQALVTIGFSGMYQAAAEQERSPSGIVIPGGN